MRANNSERTDLNPVPNNDGGEKVSAGIAHEQDTGEEITDGGVVAAGGGGTLLLEPTQTVLATPRGEHYHRPLGESCIPRCGARVGEGHDVERMTLYHAEEETDLGRCNRCPWPCEP